MFSRNNKARKLDGFECKFYMSIEQAVYNVGTFSLRYKTRIIQACSTRLIFLNAIAKKSKKNEKK